MTPPTTKISPCVVCLMGSVNGKYCSSGCAQSYRAGFLDGRAVAPKLLDALRAASEHLDYCGYGDSWERECAVDSGLIKQIEDALRTAGVKESKAKLIAMCRARAQRLGLGGKQ